MAATISVKPETMFRYDQSHKHWFARSRRVAGTEYPMDVQVVRNELIIHCGCPATSHGKTCWHEREFRKLHEARNGL